MSEPLARLETRIPPDMKAQLQQLAEARAVTMNDLVTAAITQLCEAPTAQELPKAAILERLDALEKTLETFIKVYFSITPPVPDAQVDQYGLSGMERWGQFLRLRMRKDMEW